MLEVRQRLRQILARDECTPIANIYDPLSAHIAHLAGFEVCKLSGSVGKFASLGVPDTVPLANSSDLADLCSRITRIAPEISLITDVDDGFGNAMTVFRTIRDVESTGVAGIEIEDNFIPTTFAGSDQALVTKEEQVGKLRAALEARRDADTVITARSAAVAACPTFDEALDRIGAYAETGVDALMLTGGRRCGRPEIEAIHRVARLPLLLLSPPPEVRDDPAFLAANDVKILYLGNPAFAITVKALYDCFTHLIDGGAPEDLRPLQADQELQGRVARVTEFSLIEERFIPAAIR
jgi:carboxyvinyl-carboxyphosphonate phosphorylmutase